MDKSKLKYIDTHFHVWDLNKFHYEWPTAADKEIYRNFSPKDLESEMKETPIHNAIFVQVLNNSIDEALWMLQMAEEHPFIIGIVAGLDPSEPEFPKMLDKLSKYPKFIGVRHILDFEDDDWLTHDGVLKGLALLEEKGYTFDLLLRPRLLKHVPDLGRKFPNLKMVVDHIAKPFIKDHIIDGWKEEIEKIAKYPNIFCKLSGLVTEASRDNWKIDDFKPYIKHVINVFGVQRCMFGSDWPVLKTVPPLDYVRVYEMMYELISSNLPETSISDIFRNNAIKFYHLNV